jgi:site-specific DNA recombinase
MTKERVRCAIYTRKSSEEGLEQSFNSLEAQREACMAYIHSQKHEGWTGLNNHYDDGGFSGGNMERAGLKVLLDDIKAGKLDTVVVYKVDRLTRSLTDFAKIIEIFDSHKVSFVSVTQHFNTTSSMGRLTLNVLLSFAQFEREITGERIRDKIAASKKKGMWMGGVVPQGYDCVDHRLIVNQPEAATIREIFRQYLRLGCVQQLKNYLDRKQIRSKLRTSAGGKTYGGATYSRGALYHLLNNRIYIGEIVHRDQSHAGQHGAIIPRDLWNQVAARLKENNLAHRMGKPRSTPSLLSGKLFDSNGVRFTPTHAVKNGKRYRYYTSQTVVRQEGKKPVITRFPAQELEQFALSQIHLLLQTPAKCTAGMKNSPIKGVAAERIEGLATRWPKLEACRQHEFARNILRRVTVGRTTVWIEIDKTKLLSTLLAQSPEALRQCCTRKVDILKLSGTFQVLKRGGQIRVIDPYGDSPPDRAPVTSLVKAVARAHDWYERIVAGEIHAIGQLAQESSLTRTYIMRILQCIRLSPPVIEALLTGKHRSNLSLKLILDGVPIDWREQKNKFLGYLENRL